MTSLFKKNRIVSEADSISQGLREAREARGLRLEQAAAELNISLKYLQALEAGRLAELPAGAYGKNFLREYASFLGLDPKPFLEMFEAAVIAKTRAFKKELFAKQVIKPGEMLIVPRIIRNIALAVVVLVCFVYLSYRLGEIVKPPKLDLANPEDNLITKEHSIEIIGITDPETQIVINGETILSDSGGNFLKMVSLKNGINIITVTAQKKYGREASLTRQILVES